MVGPPRSGLLTPVCISACPGAWPHEWSAGLGLRGEVSRGLQRGLRCGHRAFPGEAPVLRKTARTVMAEGGVQRRGAAAV